MTDKISIIMPSYNTAGYIGASIRSVQAQTYTNWELLIVEDCSDDGSEDVIAAFLGDARIRLLKNEHHSGAAISRNYALREARGRWIAFLDSDDLWKPEKLERQLEFMQKNGYAFGFTDYRISRNGELQPYIYTGPDVVNRRRMYDYCYVFTGTVMYDRDTVGLIQISDLKKNNDYAMWLQIVEKSSAYRLPESLSVYTRREGSVSNVRKSKLIKWHYILFRDGLGKSAPMSVLLTANNLVHGVWKKWRYRERVKKE